MRLPVDAARAAGDPPLDVAPPPSSIAAPAGDTYPDPRSPDTRQTTRTTTRPRSSPQPVADEPSAPSGFDFVSAAIGAIVAGVLLSLLLMGTLGMRRQPGGAYRERLREVSRDN